MQRLQQAALAAAAEIDGRSSKHRQYKKQQEQEQ